jgi:hypothetical protein
MSTTTEETQSERSMNPKPPARPGVILAREAPLAVVLRRGPAKQICTVLWNCRTDESTLGLRQRAPEPSRIQICVRE